MERTKRLAVKDAFAVGPRGKSKFTRAYIREHPGTHPVYSAATGAPLGEIDTYEVEGRYLSWTTNGYAGRTKVLEGRFSHTPDRGLLSPIIEGLDLEFCAIALEPLFREAARGRKPDGSSNEYTKLTADEALAVEFDVPVRENGSLDVDAQADHVRRWKEARDFQVETGSLSRLLATVNLRPAISDDVDTVEFSLNDESVFKFLRGSETNWYKKNWIDLPAGDYPVYTAARGPVVSVGVKNAKLIEASEDRVMLSFAVDGDGSAGTNFVIHREPFYVATNRAVFEVADDVDIDYVFFSLQTMKADHGFGYNYKAYRDHLEYVTVTFPAGADGRPDLAAQQALAQRLRELDAVRRGVVDLLESVTSARVLVT